MPRTAGKPSWGKARARARNKEVQGRGLRWSGHPDGCEIRPGHEHRTQPCLGHGRGVLRCTANYEGNLAIWHKIARRDALAFRKTMAKLTYCLYALNLILILISSSGLQNAVSEPTSRVAPQKAGALIRPETTEAPGVAGAWQRDSIIRLRREENGTQAVSCTLEVGNSKAGVRFSTAVSQTVGKGSTRNRDESGGLVRSEGVTWLSARGVGTSKVTRAKEKPDQTDNNGEEGPTDSMPAGHNESPPGVDLPSQRCLPEFRCPTRNCATRALDRGYANLEINIACNLPRGKKKVRIVRKTFNICSSVAKNLFNFARTVSGSIDPLRRKFSISLGLSPHGNGKIAESFRRDYRATIARRLVPSINRLSGGSSRFGLTSNESRPGRGSSGGGPYHKERGHKETEDQAGPRKNGGETNQLEKEKEEGCCCGRIASGRNPGNNRAFARQTYISIGKRAVA